MTKTIVRDLACRHVKHDKLKGLKKSLKDYAKKGFDAGFDCDHYSEKQLASIADMVLRFF